MKSAIICKASYFPLILKSMIFISLAIISYIFYFTDVVNKFAERDTTLIYSQENIEENEKNPPPFITFCTNPRAKNSILEEYKLSPGILDKPNSNDTKILISLNKTLEALFREVTFQIHRDFYLYINLWFFEEEYGWQNYEGKMKKGNDNYIEVKSNLKYDQIKQLAIFARR